MAKEEQLFNLLTGDNAGNPYLYAVNLLLQCAECLYVGAMDECWMREDKPCPNCGSYQSPTDFPGTWYQSQMFPKLQKLHQQKEDLAPAVVVFALFITESVLSHCVKQALMKKGVPSDVISVTLDGLKGSSDLSKYLAGLCGEKSLNRVLQDQPELKAVWERWESCRTLRNNIAHGVLVRATPEEAQNAFEVCLLFHQVARYILNKIIKS